MDKNDKWLMFKNYMHNELGVTKEEIQQWVKDAVKEEATRMVSDEYDNFNVAHVIKNIITGDKYNQTGWGKLREDITSTIVKELTARLEITIKAKE